MSDLAARLQTALGPTYRVERELGGGGMSRVFVAEEVTLGRRVVVKVLPPELAAGVSIDRFRREIQLAASLQHPHIVPLLTAGHADDLTYYVMPLIEGESLRARLARERELPIPEAIRIVRDVADALAYAHAHGVVHRDIKPDNVLLSSQHAVVTDFGVAKALTESAGHSSLTSVGMALGTPAYMAPEQAAADPQTDHRADIYAVGALAYELLTGRPPFSGPSPQAVLAAQVTEAPDPLTKHRASVPPALAEVVMRCLAKKPADRWQSAPDLVQQLDAMITPTGGTTSIRVSRGKRRSWAVALGAVIAVAAGSAVVVGRSGKRDVLDANLLAVAPFDVLDPQLSLWHEGLVDVLSRDLDGAGPIRTVSPTVVVRRWSGRADPTSAAELGRQTGARIAVFGQLVSTGSDSVKVRATVLDVASGRSIGEVERGDLSARMDRLADSLTVALLSELGRTRPIGAVRLASLGSGSLPAMKAFLQGEQFFRRTAWDSSIVYYQRALEQDPRFTLALHRVSTAIGWERAGTDSLSRDYGLRAGALNHGLRGRDSLLVLADSLSASAYSYRNDLEWWRQVRRMLATLKEATRRYPDDPEVWYSLGDAYFHFAVGPGIDVSLRQLLEPFDRSIALDSAFAPAYIHPVQIALMLSDGPAARRYADKYVSLAPTDVEGQGIRLAAALLDPARAGSAETQRMLDTTSAALLNNTRVAMRDWPDSAETQIKISRLLAAGRRGAFPLVADSATQNRSLARILAFRGHVREAYRIGGRSNPGLFVELSQIGVVPADTAAAQFAEWLKAAAGSTLNALPWWADRGDTTSLKTFVVKGDSIIRAGRSPVVTDRARYAVASGRAFLAVAKRDTNEAIRLFDAMPDSLCSFCTWSELRYRAALLTARGRDREAVAMLELRPAYFSAMDPPFRALERGRAYEKLGDRAKALESFAYVTDAWRNADPELKPMVDEAKAALRRLGGEPAR